MYWQYLMAVLQRALQPTTRVTDMLQIIAASTLPAVSKFFRVELPATIGNDVLAYIGAAVIAYIVIRLLWAPYSLWKDDRVEVARLKLELSKPERLVIKQIAKHKAKAISKIQSYLVEIHSATFDSPDKRVDDCSRYLHMLEKNLCQSGLDSRFYTIVNKFIDHLCERDENNDPPDKEFDEFQFFRDLVGFTEGRITIEALELRLPRDTEPKTQP